MKRTHHIHGFTLLEMSIVLTIVGLLIGGILIAKEMVRNAQLQGELAEVRRIETAIKTFHIKYNYLPGDFPGATTLWGTHPGGCAWVGMNYSTLTPLTCNGNGDGRIMHYHEHLYLWTHLSNAGLYEGQYSQGYPTGTVDSLVAGTNVPATVKIKGGAYSVIMPGVAADNAQTCCVWWNTTNTLLGDAARLSHKLIFGAANWPYGWNINPIITAKEAYNIDLKMDDGAPATGRVSTVRTDAVVGIQAALGSPNCVTNNTSTAAYTIATTVDDVCSLLFDMDF